MGNGAINPNLIGTKRQYKMGYKAKENIKLNHAPIAFRYEITRGEVILCRDEEARLKFVENAWNEYLDYRPIAEYIIRELAA